MPNQSISQGIVWGGSFVAGIPVRVKIREAHNIASRATQYAVENGDSISDHVIRTPNTVDTTFEMTNTTDTDGDGIARAQTVFIEFIRRQESRLPFILDTEHARYRNMVMVSFTPEHTAPNKGTFRAVLRTQQVGVIGDTDTINSQGGRSRNILLNDGTQVVACDATNSGFVNVDRDSIRLTFLLQKLESDSLTNGR